jgi:hypothetical protein
MTDRDPFRTSQEPEKMEALDLDVVVFLKAF